MQRIAMIPTNWPDVSEDTLRALSDGEEWAYNEVYGRYSEQVKDFLAALMGNEEDARELTHDIFLDLWLNHERIDPAKSIRGFIYVKARNRAMNWFAHKKVRAKYEDFCTAAADGYSLSAEEDAIVRETHLLTEIVLNSMSERKQAIWRLSREEGMTPSKIAKELNISQSTVTHSLTEIKRHLIEIIAMITVFFIS